MNHTTHKLHKLQTIENMKQVMGDFPTGDADVRREPPELRVLRTYHSEGIEVRLVEYVAEASDAVPAYLLVPRERRAKNGPILALHQTTKHGKAEPAGIDGSADLAYAKELAELGFIVLVPDYPGFGDYRVDPYAFGYQSTTLKAVYNHTRGIDLLLSLDEVHADSVGVIGHSLGGHNALFLAAFDERVTVVATSCGFTPFPDYKGGDLSAWAQDRYMPRVATEYGCDPDRMPFDFIDILKSIMPRKTFISAPLRDANFDNGGVVRCASEALNYCENNGFPRSIRAEYPDTTHEFPMEQRKASYDYIASVLR